MSTINEWFDARRASPSDINEHMPLLRSLAAQCCHVTEFGTRSGNSTVAFLAGLDVSFLENKMPTVLESYDIAPAAVQPPDCYTNWQFHLADTGKLERINATDMLFIDTLHDCAQVAAELKHAPRVGSWLVFHDTVLFGWREESTNGLPGIMQAILEFMATKEGRKWRVWSHDVNNCGLLVLRREKQ
jgi:cephalosporin hydroxylase